MGELFDGDGLMDLDDMTKSEMSLDQLADLPISSAEPFSECPVEKIKKGKGIGDGTSTRMIWGKTSTCSGYKKFSTKLRYKRLKRLNKNFRRDSDFKENFESANREAAPPEGGWAVQVQPSERIREGERFETRSHYGDQWLLLDVACLPTCYR